jgi:hypothetical protein
LRDTPLAPSPGEADQTGRTPSFAILCVGRVGSEHLVSLLDSHSRIKCFGELFAPPWGAGPPRATTRVPRFFESAHNDPWAYWMEITAGIDEEIVGLKLPHSSIEAHTSAAKLVAETDIDVIRLRRANRIAQYVSVALAAESGVWQSTDGSYTGHRVRIDPGRCIEALEGIVQREESLNHLAAGHRVFDLEYESLARGERMAELQRFLGAEPERLSSPYERLRTSPLEDVIENYSELAAALTNTRFAGDLEGTARRS